MIQLYPDDGLIKMLERIADNGGSGLTWALFTNDLEPDEDSVFADFALADADWGRIGVELDDFVLKQVVLHVASIQANPITFTNSEAGTVDCYGFVVYDGGSQRVFTCARFDDAPRAIAPGGDTQVTPLLGGQSISTVPIIDGGEF
jgi:hypothetical protein